MGRKESREHAFILIFEKLFHESLTYEELRKLTAESALFEIDPFCEALYTTSEAHSEEINETIRPFLRKWRLERLPKVSLALLRLAVTEILYMPEIPAPVSANEAVNLAKRYATPEDASFINGVLGSLIRGRAKAQAEAQAAGDAAADEPADGFAPEQTT